MPAAKMVTACQVRVTSRREAFLVEGELRHERVLHHHPTRNGMLGAAGVGVQEVFWGVPHHRGPELLGLDRTFERECKGESCTARAALPQQHSSMAFSLPGMGTQCLSCREHLWCATWSSPGAT